MSDETLSPEEYLQLSGFSNRPLDRTWSLIHAGLGMVTEVGEFNDQLKRHLVYGAPLDETNLLEELGDTYWYVALALRTLSATSISRRLFQIFLSRSDGPIPDVEALLVYGAWMAETAADFNARAVGQPEDIKDLERLVRLAQGLAGSLNSAARVLGSTQYRVMWMNISKLRARYPNQFESHAALSRDLKAERQALEGA